MVTLGDIFRQHGPAYRAQYGERMPLSHRRAMRAIEQCRTPALGGHVYYCEQCDTHHYYYHSCRNRHCPQCQTLKGQQWLVNQQALLLPVPYFMLTFTLPGALREVARRHQRLIYDLVFRTSAAATQHLAAQSELSPARALRGARCGVDAGRPGMSGETEALSAPGESAIAHLSRQIPRRRA